MKPPKLTQRYLPFRKKIIYEDHTMMVYSIGWLAIMSDRHCASIRKLEREGILPKPLFDRTQIDGTYRYYTAAELIGYAQLINQHPLRPGIGTKKYNDKVRVVLKNKLHEFRLELKKRVEAKQPTALIPNLPNEDSIARALAAPKDRDIKKTAEKILSRI